MSGQLRPTLRERTAEVVRVRKSRRAFLAAEQGLVVRRDGLRGDRFGVVGQQAHTTNHRALFTHAQSVAIERALYDPSGMKGAPTSTTYVPITSGIEVEGRLTFADFRDAFTHVGGELRERDADAWPLALD